MLRYALSFLILFVGLLAQAQVFVQAKPEADGFSAERLKRIDAMDGVRLISRKTVELMLTNQVAAINAAPFGLGFGLETTSNDHTSVVSLGSFSWGGAFNTHYWADPKEKLIGLIFTNIYETAHLSIGEKFKVLTYQAIVD